MKTKYKISKTLINVWELKRKVNEETKDLSIREYFDYVKKKVSKIKSKYLHRSNLMKV